VLEVVPGIAFEGLRIRPRRAAGDGPVRASFPRKDAVFIRAGALE